MATSEEDKKKKEKETEARTLPELGGVDRRQVGVRPDFEHVATEQANAIKEGAQYESAGIRPDFGRIATEQANAIKEGEQYESAGIRPDFERIATEQANAIKTGEQKVLDELTSLKSGDKAEGLQAETDYDYLKQFADKYTPSVLSEEELNRRKRGAYIREGIGALGNVAKAISNLIFTTKGAPSQTLPKNVDASAEITKLEEKERAKRNEIYQRAKDRVAQQQAREALRYKYAQDEQNNKYKALQLRMQMDELELKREKAEQDGDLQKVKILTEQWKALKAQQDAMDAAALNKARIGNYNSGSASNYARAEYYKNGGNKSGKMLDIPYVGGSFQVSKDNWNNMTYLSSLAKDLGVPVQYKRVRDAAGVESEKVEMTSEGRTIYLTKAQLQSMIGQALNNPDNKKVAAAVQRITNANSTTGDLPVKDYTPDTEEEIEEYE